MIPSRKLTSGGSLPPSCRYLWTTSRPVKRTPVISTSSPTFKPRIFSSVNGLVNWIIWRSVKPFLDLAVLIEQYSLPAIGPAHIADTDEERGRQAIGNADLDSEQCRLAAKAHRPDAQLVGCVQNILFQPV